MSPVLKKYPELAFNPETIAYPELKVFNEFYLPVGDGHQIFVQEGGNPKGEPVIYVHGGPGGGGDFPHHMQYRTHDPKRFRVIHVDQRGCGHSLPHVASARKAAFKGNTPENLAADFERVRQHLGIKKWHVFGYSWGSCLGFLYAARYPKAVATLTLGGIWMHTVQEIDWWANYMGLFRPEAEENLLKVLPQKGLKRFKRFNLIYKCITGADDALALRVAETKGRFESAACCFHPHAESFTDPQVKLTKTTAAQPDNKNYFISLGALEIYFMKRHPLPDKWYATAAVRKAIASIKTVNLFQGRYDLVCPPSMAYEVAKLHPHIKLTMAHYSGHRFRERGILETALGLNQKLPRLK